MKCMTFRKMFCFKSNDYYAEKNGLKWTENLRSVQFKFTKNLNFSSVQVLFWKSELNSVQSSPKNELLNWTELFRSVRAIHWNIPLKYTNSLSIYNTFFIRQLLKFRYIIFSFTLLLFCHIGVECRGKVCLCCVCTK